MRVIWSLILFIICIDAVAQDRKVIGRVLDSLTNKPIKDVHVVIHGTTLETFTNQLGFFEIPVVNESAAIVASHTSYKSVKVQIPSASRFSFSMNKSTIDLGRVNLNEYTNIQLIDFANTSQEQGSDNNQRGSSMESDASFRGGISAIHNFLGVKLQKISAGFSDPISIKFTINEKGRPLNIIIKDTVINSKIIEEVFNQMPDWKPATQRNMPVLQNFNISIEKSINYHGLDLDFFYDFIASNIKHPEAARRMGVEGLGCVEFEVDSLGKIISIIPQTNIRAGVEDELKRLVKTIPTHILKTLTKKTGSNKFIFTVTYILGPTEKDYYLRFNNSFDTIKKQTNAFLLGQFVVTAVGLGKDVVPFFEQTGKYTFSNKRRP